MPYFLGIDLGTTYSAAAVWRDQRAEIASLGNRAPTIPSVVFLRDDGTVLTGEAAERRAMSEPRRVAREFKRRIGDATPIIVGGTPYSADSLTGKLLRAIVDKVVELEGEAPAGIVVTHPANWGEFKKDLLQQAVAAADLDGVTMVSEPEAAAIHYASLERVDPGSVVAVYDLGGGTFDVTVLRKGEDGFEILGQPQGIERLGGIDFDVAVLEHVLTASGVGSDHLGDDDPTVLAAMARLRQDCVVAKEALSSDTDASIAVLLPGQPTEVRLTRTEFEQMIRPAVTDTLTALGRALRSAGVEPADLDAVLLVGGTSRVPLVGQLVSSELGRPVAVDAHPKHAIALGAAILAADRGGAAAAATTVVEPPVEVAPLPSFAAPPPPAEPVDEPEPALVAPAEPRPAWGEPVAPPPAAAGSEDDGGGGGGRRLLGVGLALAALVALVVAAVLVLGGDDGDGGLAAGDATTTVPDGGGTTEDTGGEEQTTTSAPVVPSGPFVDLEDVVVDDGQYRANYSVANFTPLLGSGDDLHIHFFLNTTAPENAGNNGDPPGDWDLDDDPRSFRTKFVAGEQGEATELCVVVATADHDVFDPDSGTCAPLPDV